MLAPGWRLPRIASPLLLHGERVRASFRGDTSGDERLFGNGLFLDLGHCLAQGSGECIIKSVSAGS